MELVTHIANIKPSKEKLAPGLTQIDTRVLERMRRANANLQREVAAIQSKAIESLRNDGCTAKITTLTDQLAVARRTIAELEKKVKDLTKSLEDSVANARREKKSDKAEKSWKADKTDKPQTDTQDAAGIKISVN